MKNKIEKNWLYYQYWIENKSANEIAKELGFSSGNILYWMKKYDISRRVDKEATKLAISGDKNPAKRPEVRMKLSGENNHFYGKTHSPEIKQKLSVINKTEKNIERLNKARESEIWYKAMFVNNVMFDNELKIKHKQKVNEAKKKYSGENSPRWKGGITSLYDQIRHSVNMKEWRMNVYKRDEFTCILCKSTNERLNADHIKSFSEIIAENNITTLEIALECKELWNVSNGRTLCITCHKQTKNYGVKAWKK